MYLKLIPKETYEFDASIQVWRALEHLRGSAEVGGGDAEAFLTLVIKDRLRIS